MEIQQRSGQAINNSVGRRLKIAQKIYFNEDSNISPTHHESTLARLLPCLFFFLFFLLLSKKWQAINNVGRRLKIAQRIYFSEDSNISPTHHESTLAFFLFSFLYFVSRGRMKNLLSRVICVSRLADNF